MVLRLQKLGHPCNKLSKHHCVCYLLSYFPSRNDWHGAVYIYGTVIYSPREGQEMPECLLSLSLLPAIMSLLQHRITPCHPKSSISTELQILLELCSLGIVIAVICCTHIAQSTCLIKIIRLQPVLPCGSLRTAHGSQSPVACFLRKWFKNSLRWVITCPVS